MAATPSGTIKFSDIKVLMPGTFTIFGLSNIRNFNLNSPQYGIIKISNFRNQYLFPTINSPMSSIGGCYSVRLINATYTGPVFQLRRSSDNVLQTFYTDDKQSYITSGANNTGTSFASWITTNTAYVYVWYDQSSYSVNCSNTTNSTQPAIIKLTNNFYSINFSSNLGNVVTLSSGVLPKAIFCHFYNTNTTRGTILSAKTIDYKVAFGAVTASLIVGGSTPTDWYYSSTGTKLAYNNGAVSTNVLVGAWNLLSLSATTPTNSAQLSLIGHDGVNGNVSSLNGYMIDMILYINSVIASDIIAYYNNKLF